MRTYITAIFIVIIALCLYIGEQQGLFQHNLREDEDQQGLSEQVTIHFSHVVAEDTPKGQAVLKFAELVAQRSQNKIIVDISPNGLSYNDDTELQALKKNDVQMIAPTISKLTQEAPSWSVLDLPYLVKTDQQVEKLFASDVSRSLLHDLHDANIIALAFWQNGFKQMLSKKEMIITPKDFKGLTIRTMPSNILRKQFIAVNAHPVNTSFDEVLTPAADEKIDAMENTLSNIYSKGFYTEEPHLTLSNHGILAYSVLMNQQFWHSLTAEQQRIITQSLADVTEWNIANAKKLNADNLTQLKNKDVSIHNLTLPEQQRWEQAFQPLYKTFKQTEYAHYLTEIRRAIQ